MVEVNSQGARINISAIAWVMRFLIALDYGDCKSPIPFHTIFQNLKFPKKILYI